MQVTVGIPFYNAEKTLPDAIRSVFAQTFTDWELILIDDGSTDRSLEIARSVRDPRIRVASDGTRRGLTERFNQGPALARGGLFARMDADDLMHPCRLERQVKAAAENPRPAALSTWAYSTNVRCELIGIRRPRREDISPGLLLVQNPVIHPTVMAPTRLFRENPYREQFGRANDQELWIRLAERRALDVLEEPLLFYSEAVVFRPENYFASLRGVRILTLSHGPRLVGRPRTLLLLARLSAKGLAYRAIRLARAENILFRRRTGPISDEEARAGREALERIRATCVPGLD